MLSFSLTLWILCILLVATIQDIKTRTIDNRLILCGFGGLIILQILEQKVEWQSLIIGILGGLTLWQLKIIGGGDSKLLMLVSLAFPVSHLIALYLSISLAGGVHALIWYTLKKESALPYAVSILAGSLFVLLTGRI